jgi:hypothetical protein
VSDRVRSEPRHAALMRTRGGGKPAGPLAGRVAVAADATVGVARGIVRALEAGATVYCTGRSAAGKPDYDRSS